MLKNPLDIRAQRTETQLQTALLTLLERKPLHQITVAELCRICQINRATFYDHFSNIFALADAIEDDIISHLKELMAYVENEPLESSEISGLFFQFLKEFRDPLRLLLEGETSHSFFQKLDGVILPFFDKMARKNYHIPPECGGEPFLSILRFLTSGYYGFFLQGIRQNEAVQPEWPQLAAKICDQCLSGFFERVRPGL